MAVAIVIAAVSIGLPLAALAYQTWLVPISSPPPPISYPDLPNPVENPLEPGVPLDRSITPKFRAGDLIVTMPYRCVTDDGGTGLGVLEYSFTRSLYDAASGERVQDLPSGTNTADVGCKRIRSTIHYVPPGTPPGRYYIGGTVSAVGAKRAGTVAWRTVTFEVVP